MRWSNYTVLIAIVVVLLLAFGSYYQTASRSAAAEAGDRVLGFEIWEDDAGVSHFAVLMTSAAGDLRVDVYSDGGSLEARIPFTEPREGSSPVRILPE